MNSRTLQCTETWTEIARLFARLALGSSFLSAVAARFGVWGKERILGKLCPFCGVHALRDGPFPQFTNRIACMSLLLSGRRSLGCG